MIGLSDFQKMLATVMKTSYRKIEQKVINYRHYKSFSKEKFREPLNENLRRVIIEKLLTTLGIL